MSAESFPPFYINAGLVDGKLVEVVAEAAHWLQPDEIHKETFSLPEMDTYKYRPGHSYAYLWAPVSKPNGCVIVGNCSAAWNVARLFARQVIFVRVAPPADKEGISEFQLYEQGVQKRFVRAFRDDTRWDFWEEGQRLPFERQDFYLKRRIRDRLPPSLLQSYCQALDWQLEPDALFATKEPAIRLIRYWTHKDKAVST
jgi:hypothetical protein